MITLHLYATFRLIAGVKTITLDLPTGTSLRAAMQAAVAQVPALARHWFDADGVTIHAHVHGILRGEDVANLPGGWDAPLQADEQVDFFPPVAGG